jgi:hypothetical protein
MVRKKIGKRERKAYETNRYLLFQARLNVEEHRRLAVAAAELNITPQMFFRRLLNGLSDDIVRGDAPKILKIGD